MRHSLAAALLLAPALASAQFYFVQVAGASPIDLDRPGVMDRIAQDDPAQYAKISAILETVSVQPCETLPKLLQADFNVTQTKCSPFVLLASYPPKRTVSFQLDDVSYISNVTVDHKPQMRAEPVNTPIRPLK